MIKKQSDDPDVAAAAAKALDIINRTLSKLPKATEYDYGGHHLKLGEYDVCEQCTRPIAEAQAAEQTLRTEAEIIDDPIIAEHLTLAADFFHHEAESAVVRAELHNGFGTEPIVDRLLGYQFERSIHDDYHHTHQGEAQ